MLNGCIQLAKADLNMLDWFKKYPGRFIFWQRKEMEKGYKTATL